jgi:hypothetical protein
MNGKNISFSNKTHVILVYQFYYYYYLLILQSVNNLGFNSKFSSDNRFIHLLIIDNLELKYVPGGSYVGSTLNFEVKSGVIKLFVFVKFFVNFVFSIICVFVLDV